MLELTFALVSFASPSFFLFRFSVKILLFTLISRHSFKNSNL